VRRLSRSLLQLLLRARNEGRGGRCRRGQVVASVKPVGNFFFFFLLLLPLLLLLLLGLIEG
jgi:hypothetical protein